MEVLGCQSDLTEVVLAGGSPGRLSRRLNGGQEQSDQDANNGDHDEQLNERKANPARAPESKRHHVLELPPNSKTAFS
jgi:hypothetical protein